MKFRPALQHNLAHYLFLYIIIIFNKSYIDK